MIRTIPAAASERGRQFLRNKKSKKEKIVLDNLRSMLYNTNQHGTAKVGSKNIFRKNEKST